MPHLQRALSVLLLKNYKVVVMHLQHAAEVRDSSAQMQGRARNYSGKLASFKFLLLCICCPAIDEDINQWSSPEDYHAALAVGHWMESGERSRRPTLMD